jgi:peptidoglycan/LPS O-acetylase OafA/YrhL
LIHFWSLAVEEQFYLLWPWIVWLFPDRRKLIGIASALIACSFVVRLAAPLFLFSPMVVQWYTPTRVDAILMGVVLPRSSCLAPDSLARIGYFTPARADAILMGVLPSLICENTLYRRLIPMAKWAAIAGVITTLLQAFYNGEMWTFTYAGREFSIFLAKVTAVAIIVAVKGSPANRLCSQRWGCWLGSLSYGLYVFHLIFSTFFIYYLTPRFDAHMRHSLALLASSVLAFCTTLVLSLLSYRFIEGPIMNLNRHVQYGAEARPLPTYPGGLASAGD